MPVVIKHPLTKSPIAEPVEELRYHLHKQMSGPRPGRQITNVHASDIVNPLKTFCSRERILARLLNRGEATEWLTTSKTLTFEIGNHIQDYIMLTLGRAGVGYADWFCGRCGKFYPMQLMPKSCACGEFQPTYKEHRFKSLSTGISCGVDAFVKLGPNMVPVEIKTIDKDEYKKLSAPLAEHLIRTRLYLWIMHDTEDPFVKKYNPQFARVLYATKGGFGTKAPDIARFKTKDQGFSPFKEFKITRDDKYIEHLLPTVKAYGTFMKKGEIPPRICPTPTCPRAYNCTVAAECFTKTFPPGAKFNASLVKIKD